MRNKAANHKQVNVYYDFTSVLLIGVDVLALSMTLLSHHDVDVREARDMRLQK